MSISLQAAISLFLFTLSISASAEDLAKQEPKSVTYTRIVVDEAGDSHFVEGELPMALASYAQPEPKLGLSAKYKVPEDVMNAIKLGEWIDE
jgi:hypothetical protein